MNNMIKMILRALVPIIPSLLLATAPQTTASTKNLAVFYTVDGNIEKEYNELAEKKLKSIGFNLSNPHKRVNDQYEAKYGSTVLDVLSFMSIVNDENVIPLLNIDPRIAAFAPFNMLIHKKLDEKVTHVGHLMPELMLDIIGIDDKEIREKFSASFVPLDELIEKEFKAKGLNFKKSYMPYKKMAKKRMINFEYEFEAPEDIDDFIDEFQNSFELAFIDKQYLIAGYHNFMDGTDDAEDILEGYSAFWTYSLCHLEYSYSMFDNEGARPEAGLFAPCTIYIYIKKDSNKVVLGMPTLTNWSATLGITDKNRLGYIQKLEKQIPEILTTFGMKAVANVNPLTQTDSPVSTTSVTQAREKKIETKRANGKTTHAVLSAPPKVPSEVQVGKIDGDVHDNTNIGEVNNGKISAFLRGSFLDVKTVEEKLKAAGFEIVASIPIDKKGTLTSVVFTNKELINMASKENRGFMASLRVLVDTKKKRISIINPLYIAKGFLQDDYNEKAAKKILAQLIAHFSGLKNSKDMLDFQLLEKYQFMFGMPHYEDMEVVASGDDLLKKVKNNKKVLFTQTLNNGSTLIGIQLGKRTNKFTSRIGTNNAALLPYPILIENGKAKIMAPKYYIAFMYPLLSMSEFMTIATTPDAIIKDCEKIFK